MKKTLLPLLLALMLLLSACSVLSPSPTPTPSATPRPTPSPRPVGMALWRENTERLFNMDYADFAEYWSLMTGELYGDSIGAVLGVLQFPEKDAEIAEKRKSFDGKYGKDWRYEIAECKTEELSERDCENFEAELRDLAERSLIVLSELRGRSDAEWQSFAEAKGCTPEKAKSLIPAFEHIEELCRSAEVSEAKKLTMTLRFHGSKTADSHRTETDCVYKIGENYYSEILIDYSLALINLVK